MNGSNGLAPMKTCEHFSSAPPVLHPFKKVSSIVPERQVLKEDMLNNCANLPSSLTPVFAAGRGGNGLADKKESRQGEYKTMISQQAE
jgi:hypothetical protein